LRISTAFFVIVVVCLVSSVDAAPLVSINPKLLAPDRGPARSDSDSPTSTVTLSVANLTNSRWLFGAVVEATSSPRTIEIGVGSNPIVVRLAIEGELLVIYRDSPLIPRETIVNRYPCRVTGDTVAVDLGHPEVPTTTVTLLSEGWDGRSGGQVYDGPNESAYLGWVEKYLLTPKPPSSSEPMTLFLRMFLKRCEESGYESREYSSNDQSLFGFLMTQVPKLSPLGEPSPVNMINRFDLKKPIVYYIHPQTPEKYRDAMAQGILSWNDLFQAARGVRPIEVRVGDPKMLPSDTRYNVIYWIDQIIDGCGGAMGPNTADPRTGEIIQGRVMIWGRRYVANLTRQYESGRSEVAKPSSLANRDSGPQKMTVRVGSTQILTFDLGFEDPVNPDRTLETVANLRTPVELDKQIGVFLRGVVCHEVGHTLGLRHNFSASADSENLSPREISTSIMDYLDMAKMVAPGIYDRAAIAYGYGGDPKLWQGRTFRFFTDPHCGVVPDCNHWDVGDPLTFFRSKFEKSDREAADGAAKGKFDADSYTESAANIFEHVRKYVGGDSARSSSAFAFMHAQMVSSPPKNANADQIRHSTLRRSLIARLLMAPKPTVMEGSWSPLAAFGALSAKERGQLTDTLAHAVGNDDDIYAFRVNAIDYLKRLQTQEANAALKSTHRALLFSSVWGGLDPLGSAQARQKAKERSEIRTRVKQTIATYFNPVPAP